MFVSFERDILNFTFATMAMVAVVAFGQVHQLIRKASRVKSRALPESTKRFLRHRRPTLSRLKRHWRRVVLFPAFVLSIAANVVEIWGPPWPTKPTFSPGFPSSGFPLDVPFIVTNKSGFFPIKNLRLECHVLKLITERNILFEHISFGDFGGRGRLEPTEPRPYVCRFSQFIRIGSNDHITAATIGFVSEYDTPWPWGSRVLTASNVFTLNTKTNPPQWMPGVPLP